MNLVDPRFLERGEAEATPLGHEAEAAGSTEAKHHAADPSSVTLRLSCNPVAATLDGVSLAFAHDDE